MSWKSAGCALCAVCDEATCLLFAGFGGETLRPLLGSPGGYPITLGEKRDYKNEANNESRSRAYKTNAPEIQQEAVAACWDLNP